MWKLFWIRFKTELVGSPLLYCCVVGCVTVCLLTAMLVRLLFRLLCSGKPLWSHSHVMLRHRYLLTSRNKQEQRAMFYNKMYFFIVTVTSSTERKTCCRFTFILHTTEHTLTENQTLSTPLTELVSLTSVTFFLHGCCLNWTATNSEWRLSSVGFIALVSLLNQNCGLFICFTFRIDCLQLLVFKK